MLSGHPWKLNPVINGQPPDYPFTEIPELPEGYTWEDILYVIGGYNWKARFVNLEGYIITNPPGETGDSEYLNQYNFANPIVGSDAGWVTYNSGVENKPYDCGGCHTTGYNPRSNQDDLPGLIGTWAEPGIQCEACHGPGSLHAQNPMGVALKIDRDPEMCGKCHRRGDVTEVDASGGFIQHHEQYEELFQSKHLTLNCVTCHNPGSVDPESTNTVNMSTMTHNIHAGALGGTVRDGGRYYIVGFRSTVYDYSNIRWTQDLRNCQTCHEESDSNTPQASNWRTVVNAEACGSCHHSNVDFVTGENHAAGASTDDQCSACHGPNSTFANGALRAEVVHKVPTVEAGRRFQFNVLSVTNTAPGELPVVRFSVTDPTAGNTPYDIHTAAPFTRCAGGASRLFVDIGWSTSDYTNVGSGFNPGQPVQVNVLNACGGSSVNNGDGSFTATSPVAVPAGQTGSLVAALEGHPALDADGNGTIDRIAVRNAVRYAPITGSLVPRREVVEIARCNDCHNQLSIHGNNRTDSIETCVICHAPGATDVNRRVAGSACDTALGLDDSTIDMKVMIHGIHAANYSACGFGNMPHDYSGVIYVGRLNNCEGCHKPDTYYPVDATRVIGTTTSANDPTIFTDDVVTSPNTAVCSTCHTSVTARAHMEGNGGDYNAGKDASGRMVSADLETCTLCHGPGRAQDVKTVHRIGEFAVYNVRDND